MQNFVRQIFSDMVDPRRGQRGAGVMEFVITLPIWAMFVIAIAYFIQLTYTHLATITVAGDCAAITAQTAAVEGNDFGLGSVAQRAVRSAYGWQGVVGLSSGQCSAATEGPHNVWGGSESIHYDFIYPFQPYRSNWKAGLR
jgi:hypothetical protein